MFQAVVTGKADIPMMPELLFKINESPGAPTPPTVRFGTEDTG